MWSPSGAFLVLDNLGGGPGERPGGTQGSLGLKLLLWPLRPCRPPVGSPAGSWNVCQRANAGLETSRVSLPPLHWPPDFPSHAWLASLGHLSREGWEVEFFILPVFQIYRNSEERLI